MTKRNGTRDGFVPEGIGRHERFLTVTLYPEASPRLPWIRLRGSWLLQAGFAPQARIRVRVMRGVSGHHDRVGTPPCSAPPTGRLKKKPLHPGSPEVVAFYFEIQEGGGERWADKAVAPPTYRAEPNVGLMKR